MKSLILQGLIGFTLALTAVSTVRAQNNLTIEEVKDGLYSISGNGGNVGVRVTAEGVILVKNLLDKSVTNQSNTF
jgi:hypothetical protein